MTMAGRCCDEGKRKNAVELEEKDQKSNALNKCASSAIEQFVIPHMEESARCSQLVLRIVKTLTGNLVHIDPRLVECFGDNLGKVDATYVAGGTKLKEFICTLALDSGKIDKLFQITTFARDINIPDLCAICKAKDYSAKNEQLSDWTEFLNDQGNLIPEKLNRLLYEGIENALMIYGDEFEDVSLVEAPSGVVTLIIKDGGHRLSVKLVVSVLCSGLPPGARMPVRWPNHPYAKGKSKAFIKKIHKDIDSGMRMWCLVGKEFSPVKGVGKAHNEELTPSLWYISMATLEQRFIEGEKVDGEDMTQTEENKCRELVLSFFHVLREGPESSLKILTDRHLQTLLLWECNRHGNWSTDVIGERVFSMLRRLRDDLKLNTLPDFFYVDLNIFSDLSTHLRRAMHSAVRQMLKNIEYDPENMFYYLSVTEQ
ncbi:protein mab-21-like 2-A [Saccoglossus kowalevskii]|uniref:Uncharacterized protein LOC100372034 n=1 Tax=Saccoglossus kowalevskii TaxID=10224 RepID=A0ABM0GUB7_SACKO|nr:PREDICTED: uncharacterized protein LOC100372034 [Saccoglossus kowalevskii]